MQGNLFLRFREKKRWNLSQRLGALLRQSLVALLAGGKKTRAIFQRTSRQCNASYKQQRKNYTLLNWTRKALMAKSPNHPGIRTRLLPSKVFRAVLIFQLME